MKRPNERANAHRRTVIAPGANRRRQHRAAQRRPPNELPQTRLPSIYPFSSITQFPSVLFSQGLIHSTIMLTSDAKLWYLQAHILHHVEILPWE